jgi:hypothetical protein
MLEKSIEGPTDLENVVATRRGLSSRSIVVIAHRDAARGPAAAELSGTAVLLELARLFADRDLRKTVVLASVSGGSGGFSGARRLAESLDAPVDAVLVLGDLAGRAVRRPVVVPWANGADPAPHALVRTAQAALRSELVANPGRDRATVQWIRRALPLTLSEQGAPGGAGLPAVLISASGERRPAADAPIRERRMARFGRGVLRTLTAVMEAGGIESDPAARRDLPTFAGGDGIVSMNRLVPDWAVRLMILALLLPPLVAAFDAFFRARRRGLPVGRWVLWVASLAIAPLVAWGWARLLDLLGAVVALPAPAAQGVVPLGTEGWISMASVAVVFAGAAFGLRPMLVRAIGARGDAAAGGAAAATGLLLAGLVALVWLFNPYAAGVLLPATHAWLLASEPGSRLRGLVAVPVVLTGLVLPVVVLTYFAYAWGLGPVESVWTGFGIVAGGALGPLAALAVSGFVAALCATVVILRSRGRAASAAPPDRIVTRGPRSYAGPGSLGGTESALRP